MKTKKILIAVFLLGGMALVGFSTFFCGEKERVEVRQKESQSSEGLSLPPRRPFPGQSSTHDLDNLEKDIDSIADLKMVSFISGFIFCIAGLSLLWRLPEKRK